MRGEFASKPTLIHISDHFNPRLQNWKMLPPDLNVSMFSVQFYIPFCWAKVWVKIEIHRIIPALSFLSAHINTLNIIFTSSNILAQVLLRLKELKEMSILEA